MTTTNKNLRSNILSTLDTVTGEETEARVMREATDAGYSAADVDAEIDRMLDDGTLRASLTLSYGTEPVYATLYRTDRLDGRAAFLARVAARAA